MLAKTHAAAVHGVDARTIEVEDVANCDQLQSIKFSKTYPYAFTEHGAIMLASVLNSDLKRIKGSCYWALCLESLVKTPLASLV